MTDDPARPSADTTPALPADPVASPEQPPMDDAAGEEAAEIEVEDEAAKLGDFA